LIYPDFMIKFSHAFIFTTTLTVTAYLAFTWKAKLTYLLEYAYKQSTEYDLLPENLRSQFNELNILSGHVDLNHTHGSSAAHRSDGSNFFDRLCSRLGRSAYYYQRSRSDERRARDGSRVHYWIKDLQAAFSPERKLDSREIMCMVDVDEYVDMPVFITENFGPLLLYTFQPTQVARATGEYTYTFDESNGVEYTVAGSGHYYHRVWNYGHDAIVGKRYCLGILTSMSAYLVERKHVDLDHEAILLCPLRHWTWPWCWFASWLEHGKLEKYQVAHPPFTRLNIQRKTGRFTSTGRVNEYLCATISTQSDDALAILARQSKVDLTLPQAMQFTDGDREAGMILMDYHRTMAEQKQGPKIMTVFPLDQAVRRYQHSTHNLPDDTNKRSMTPFMTPIVHGAFAPDICKDNEDWCVKARITDVKVEKPVTPFISKIIQEFAELLIPIPHTVDPVEIDEVYERQKRPMQRHILEESQYYDADRKIKMFPKKEAYQQPKPPRPISTINGSDKAAYSRFIYAFVEAIIKHQPWYAFGKTPREVAQRVVNILFDAETATNSDFNKFDGHVGEIIRELERVCMLRAFRLRYHDEILKLLGSQFNLFAFAFFGAIYFTGFARASGSPETAAFNSLANAFLAYFAKRRSPLGNGFYSPQEAWTSLGIYGGDDGITPDIDPKVYVESCAMVGQVLTVEMVKRGEFGIKFLARMYGPQVWFGDTNSCCDLARQMSKFHVTVRLPLNITPGLKLMEKARAFWLTDENTPVLGPFVTRVVEMSGMDEENMHVALVDEIARWGSDIEKEVQYPNYPAEWMDHYAMEALPGFEYDKFLDWLCDCRTLDELLHAPMFMEPIAVQPPAVGLIVDEDVIPPKQPAAEPPGPPPTEKPKRKRHRKDKGKQEERDIPQKKPPSPPKNVEPPSNPGPRTEENRNNERKRGNRRSRGRGRGNHRGRGRGGKK
jgi:hypothetical protein